MDQREIENAIKQIKGVHSILMQSHVSIEHCMEYKGTAKIAIDALEKQIPKKPETVEAQIHGEIRTYHYCTSCEDKQVFRMRDKYCPRCGQAIDWNEVE